MSYNAITAGDIAAAIASTVPTLQVMLNAINSISNGTAYQFPRGAKSFSFLLSGTGAVTATVEIQVSNDNTNWLSHASYTVALSGTNVDFDGFMDADTWKYHRAAIVALTGTAAAVTVTASY